MNQSIILAIAIFISFAFAGIQTERLKTSENKLSAINKEIDLLKKESEENNKKFHEAQKKSNEAMAEANEKIISILQERMPKGCENIMQWGEYEAIEFK